MPQAKNKPSQGLSIVLKDGKLFYSPGDDVSGAVSLNTAEDFAIGTVNLDFYGRAKVRYTRSTGQGTVTYRGRALLFATSQVLFSDFHTHKPGSWEWPFQLSLPRAADSAMVRDTERKWTQSWGPAAHFITTEDLVTDRALPPSFGISKWGFGFQWHGFVEYVVQVTVVPPDSGGIMSRWSSKIATLPIGVRSTATSGSSPFSLPCAIPFNLPENAPEKSGLNPGLHEQQFTTRRTRHLVQNSNLLLATQESSRSFATAFKDKTKLLFSSDALPRYTFDLTVRFPQTAQLLSKDSIRLLVQAATVFGVQDTSVAEDAMPSVVIANVSLGVIIKTYVRFKAIMSSPQKTSREVVLVDKLPINKRLPMEIKSLSESSSAGEAVHSTTDNEIDLSTTSGWTTSLVSAKPGRKEELPLAESFTTYIIAREYRLKYTLELEVAGQKIKVSNGGHDLLIVTPPEAADLEKLYSSGVIPVQDEDDNDDSDAESAERGPRAKKSKADEAAEERSTAEASSSASAGQDILPPYEHTSPGLAGGFRNEINEQPPDYRKS